MMLMVALVTMALSGSAVFVSTDHTTSLSWIADPCASMKDSPLKKLDRLFSFACSATVAFGDLVKEVKKLGQSAERDYVRDRMEDLSSDLYQIERDKAALVRMLRRQNPDWDQARESNQRLKASIERTDATLKRIGSKLRSRGSNVEVDQQPLDAWLSDVLNSKDEWLDRLRNPAASDRQSLLAFGDSMVLALQNAQKHLKAAAEELDK